MLSLCSKVSLALALSGLVRPHLASADALPDTSIARVFHAAAKLPNGGVLITGGHDRSAAKASAEIFDPNSNAFVPLAAAMTTARSSHTATELADGRVLIVGGWGNTAGSGSVDLNTAEIFDPATLQFAPTSLLSTPRRGHSATRLADGRVLLFGGTNDVPKTAELFDPTTQAFQVVAYSGIGSRSGHTATLLPNGKVLLVGGRPPQQTNTAELFDPATGTFSTTSALAMRAEHTATLLPDGKVLVAGGLTAATTGRISYHRSLELYDYATNSFTMLPTAMALPRAWHTATLVPADNAVLIAGGEFGRDLTNAIEVYGCSTGSLKLLAPTTMQGIRASHTATSLGDSRIMIVGGYGSMALAVATKVEMIDLSSVSEAPPPAITSFNYSRGGAVWIVGTAVPNYMVRIQTSNSPTENFADLITAIERQCDTNGVFSFYAPLYRDDAKAPRFFRAIIP